MKNKVVFIDRDGTINVDKGYVHKIEDFELIPGSLEALQLLTQAGVATYIITNQAGIAKGYYSEKEFLEFTEYTLQFFKKNNIKIKEVLYCPHHPEGTVKEYSIECECRKPAAKLIQTVLKDLEIPMQNIALFGDKKSDIEAGEKVGIKTYLVRTGYGKDYELTAHPDYVSNNLKDAVLHFLNN